MGHYQFCFRLIGAEIVNNFEGCFSIITLIEIVGINQSQPNSFCRIP